MSRVRVETVYLVPVCIAIVMAVNQYGLWSRIMVSAGIEELALTTFHDNEKVKLGR